MTKKMKTGSYRSFRAFCRLNYFFDLEKCRKIQKYIVESLVLTTQQCASTDCWSLEDGECKLREECHTYLRCSPQIVDFRYMREKLFGNYRKDMTADIDDPCPVAESTDSNGVILIKLI